MERIRNFIDWKLFLPIFLLGSLGVFAVIPYSLPIFEKAAQESGMPLNTLILISTGQNFIFLFLCVSLGLFLAEKNEFPLPFFKRLTDKRAPRRTSSGFLK